MGLLTALAVAAGTAGAAGGVLFFAPVALATIGYSAAVGVTAVANAGLLTGTAAVAGSAGASAAATAPVAGLVMALF
uniref:uncharacterized protein LOC131139939 isoform X2 n=1 Tax=Doryrhamphus excisus TaxID=161450 RepID=UPI0025AE907F|nr:uncharacterized protein LOC131139939 isoform X2 [Doryrhamphus excisus]